MLPNLGQPSVYFLVIAECNEHRDELMGKPKVE